MLEESALGLTYLDHCLSDLDSLRRLKKALERIEQCCLGLEKRHNMGDILQDSKNRVALAKAFGPQDYEAGLQLLLKIALKDYRSSSVTTSKEISGKKKMDFFHSCLGGWKQFDCILSLHFPNGSPLNSILVFNPKRSAHWTKIPSIPKGTLCAFFIRGFGVKRSPTQEMLALERFEAVFDVVENDPKAMEANPPAPVVQLHRTGSKAAPPRFKSAPRSSVNIDPKAPPVASLRIVINKMDTFVHAGNAQMIMSHLRGYSGRVRFFVLRAEKKLISLDPDSIWSAEIRNGESVLFEFFGPKPEESFLKELAKKVNKYSQMDKIING